VLALQAQQPVLVHQRAAVDVAAAQHGRDARGDFHVVLGNEAPLQHVHQHHLEGGDADVAGDRDLPGRQGGAPAGLGQRACLGSRHVQQFEGVEHHHVAVARQLHLLRLEGRGRDLAHRDGFEVGLEAGEHVAAGTGRQADPRRDFLQPAAGGQQADASLDQPDVALQREHRARRVHLELAAAAQRHAAHRRDHGHQRVLDAHRGRLEIGDHRAELVHLARGQRRHRAGQVRARGERLLRLPQHQALEVALGNVDRLLDPGEHAIADGVHLGLERQHRDAVAVVPQAHGIGLEHRLAGREALAQHRVGEALAGVHRVGRTRHARIARRAVAAIRPVRAVLRVHPGRQRRVGHALAGGDVLADPAGDVAPAGRLPALERPEAPAVAPADREVDVARRVGDRLQVVGAVVEQVAEAGPQEPGLRMRARAQRGELGGRVAVLEDLDHLGRGLRRRRPVIAGGEVEHDDVLAALLEDAGAGLLPERTLGDQRLQPIGGDEILVPRILGQGVGHGLDHVRHRVQAHDIGRPVGRRLRPAEQRAGERVDRVEAEAEGGGVVQCRQDREHADPVADEVGRVLGVHDALAQRRHEEGLQAVEHRRVRRGAGDQLGQVHVARRVEEVHAAEPVMK
jgi:hypothetical protein